MIEHDELTELKAKYVLLKDRYDKLEANSDDLFNAINNAYPDWLERFLDKRDAGDCDTCIGKPDDTCPDCERCGHQCECEEGTGIDVPAQTQAIPRKENDIDSETKKRAPLMGAIDALHRTCPRTVYIITDDLIERMRVDRVELYLESGNVVFVHKNTGKPAAPFDENKKPLTAVILDEDEAVKQWKEKGKK